MAKDTGDTWFERLIRDAEAAGEFDDLEGAGRPIEGLDRHYEPAWWAKRYVAKERVNERMISLASRIRESMPRLLASRDELSIREKLIAFNVEIDALNADAVDRDHLPRLDVDRILDARRRRHS